MDEDRCWQAVIGRDRDADGAFVYAVCSTGIYCRPSCAARRPRRENARFFRLPQVAERAGYRPCRRCRPREVAATDPRVELVRRTCHEIETRADDTPRLATLGAQMGVSPHHLQRTFKAYMGITPRQYADVCRLSRLKAGLRDGNGVTEALYEAGYGSASRLYERAPALLGMTPTVYRRGGEGMSIQYTVTDSPLGRLLVAGTERGICAVSLGAADATLEAALHSEYPAATITRADGCLREAVVTLLRHLDGRHPHLGLPLDLQATAFRWRVWEALRAIPYGSTRSYGEIAAMLGEPHAARAVGGACGSNPVAIVIPCHRAVRSDGSMGGYRWGVDCKERLLELEQQPQGRWRETEIAR
jgi:AraC family transcriptional regulator, regulatory protein of adaptative response / methylated-DNA-[protein]-cysteine methyltransferase